MLYGIAMLVCIVFIDLVFFSAGLEIFLLFAPWFDAAIIGIFWFIYEYYRTPREAKILRKCKNEKRIPVITEDDSNILEIDYEESSTPEGAILTKQNGPMFTPRSIVADNPEEADALRTIHPVVAKTSYMPGVGMPVRLGYKGKAILTNVRTAAELQYGSPEMTGNPLPHQTEKVGKENKEVTIFWPVSLRTLKSYFSKQWNIAAIRAMEKRSELIGVMKERKRHRQEKIWIMLLIAAGFCIMAFALAIYALR